MYNIGLGIDDKITVKKVTNVTNAERGVGGNAAQHLSAPGKRMKLLGEMESHVVTSRGGSEIFRPRWE